MFRMKFFFLVMFQINNYNACFVPALLFGGMLNGHSRHVGCIDPSCGVLGVVKDAYENARFLCDQYYLASPELKLTEYNGKCKRKTKLLQLCKLQEIIMSVCSFNFRTGKRKRD